MAHINKITVNAKAKEPNSGAPGMNLKTFS
jgi:hypothetical protein